ncbi:LPXTG cell wall anchor domain-containing protein [Streptomyces fragilis]|uniref:LPXTG cell wall anchor domain-containing protein n=1 Tax=Streptomyces fragilis TaxID=67301 RepID=A0ABV2YG86_9ACTN|nr:LPXTG cell wall anchor domain-containing protein [Streptomyces fragilis]
MHKRRYLAVAAALAVTAPVALSASSPAFAEPSAPAAAEAGTTVQELEKALEEARAAHSAAVLARIEAYGELEALVDPDKSDPPALVVAAEEARKAADEAKAALDAAVTRVGAARTALAEADEAGRAAAEQELADAELALEDARQAHVEAAEKAKTAGTALDDAQVEAARAYELAKQTEKAAKEKAEAAEKALADAKKCTQAEELKSKAVGLPEQLVAGDRVPFTFRITNGTEHTVDVEPLTFVVLDSPGADQEDLEVEWKSRDGWVELEPAGSPELVVEDLEPGSQARIRMRLTVDEDTPKSHLHASFAADPVTGSVPCLFGPMKNYGIDVLPAGSTPSPSPGDGASPSPSTSASPAPGASATPGAAPQGGTGSLAATGSTVTPVALTAASALVLGAGAVVVSRRRRAEVRS